jgi:DNA-binding HxlR family transcriptional regulator
MVDAVKSNIKKDQKRDLLDVAMEELDQTCFSIFGVIMEDRTIRFSELQTSLIKISGLELTHRVLSKHLKHLIQKGLVKRTEEGFQNVTYSMSDSFRALYELPVEEIKKYIELETDESLPPKLRAYKVRKEDFAFVQSEKELDRKTDYDLHDVLSLSLWEFKLAIENDLLLKEGESDHAFWNFLANPIYRIHEKDIAEKCRFNEHYKNMLFEKIDLLTTGLRNDRELFRKRRDAGKRVS